MTPRLPKTGGSKTHEKGVFLGGGPKMALFEGSPYGVDPEVFLGDGSQKDLKT